MKKPCLVCAIEANNWKHADEILLESDAKRVKQVLSNHSADPMKIAAEHAYLMEALKNGNGLALSSAGIVLSANQKIEELYKGRLVGQARTRLVVPDYHKISNHSAEHFIEYNAVMVMPGCERKCHECGDWPCKKSGRIRVRLTPYPIVIADNLITLRLTVVSNESIIELPKECL